MNDQELRLACIKEAVAMKLNGISGEEKSVVDIAKELMLFIELGGKE